MDDRVLVEGAKAGSADAIGALYRRYWPLAWQWAYAVAGSRERADDLAQLAFLRAVDALPRFDGERPFGAWLKRIVINVAIDDIRRLRRSPLPLEWFSEARAATPAPSTNNYDELVEAVRGLQPARRQIIVLHYWLDLSVDEIAAHLGLPFGTVASRLSRARADLRETLREQRV